MKNLINQIAEEIEYDVKFISNVSIEGHFVSFILNNNNLVSTADLTKSRKKIKKNSARLNWF